MKQRRGALHANIHEGDNSGLTIKRKWSVLPLDPNNLTRGDRDPSNDNFL